MVDAADLPEALRVQLAALDQARARSDRAKRSARRGAQWSILSTDAQLNAQLKRDVCHESRLRGRRSDRRDWRLNGAGGAPRQHWRLASAGPGPRGADSTDDEEPVPAELVELDNALTADVAAAVGPRVQGATDSTCKDGGSGQRQSHRRTCAPSTRGRDGEPVAQLHTMSRLSCAFCQNLCSCCRWRRRRRSRRPPAWRTARRRRRSRATARPPPPAQVGLGRRLHFGRPDTSRSPGTAAWAADSTGPHRCSRAQSAWRQWSAVPNEQE
jgi:hypothetical protein